MSKILLKDIISYKKGNAFKSTDYQKDGVAIVRVSDFENDTINLNNLYYVSKEVADKNKNVILNKYDVVVTTVGASAGNFIRVPEMAEGYLLNQNAVRLRINSDEKFEKIYLFYALKYKKFTQYLLAGAQGSAQPSIVLDQILNAEIPYPKKDRRKYISEVLFTLDEKIELNTQINQTLEQIAQTIFKSWFIDFDPVHAKANAVANGQTAEQATQAAMAVISGKNTHELHRLQTANPEQYQQLWEIAEAFPSGFDEEGVPWGWEEKPLPELIDFLEGPGIRNWQYTEEEDGIKFINIRCIKNGDLSLETANKITREEAFGKYAHFQLKEDDIVISTSGTLGRFALVRNEHLPLCLNTSVIRFRPIENKSTLAFLLGLASNQLQYELEARASGSVQRNFGPTHLKQISVLLPDFYLLSLHNKYISTLFELRKSNLRENDLLMKTRDVLLPKLLSGEV